MNGARQFYPYFTDGEILFDRIRIAKHTHARGQCFQMYLLPKKEGDKQIAIYDVVSGQRGWTETYGWVHEGKWTDDFNREFELRRKARELDNERAEIEKEIQDQEKEDDVRSLLEDY